MNETQSKENHPEQDAQLTDLEPQGEVVGGIKELTGTLILPSANSTEPLQKKHIANIKWAP